MQTDVRSTRIESWQISLRIFSVFANWVLLLVPSLATAGSGIGGFFYAIEAPSGSDRLWRIDVDDSFSVLATPIGGEGALGFPEVVELAWDGVTERLLGYDQLLRVVVEIDTIFGTATTLFPFDPNSALHGMTFNTNDESIYFLDSSASLYAIDSAGVIEKLTVIDTCTNAGLAYATSAVGGLNGLYTITWSGCGAGLKFYIEPNWDVLYLGGATTGGATRITWDSVGHRLFSLDMNQIYQINPTTGSRTLLATLDLGIELASFVFVPSGSPQPTCLLMDSDADGDRDLADFAAFQDCFTGAK